ncbi:MAG: hypothetical protein Q4C95_04855 [Planctomycetia bacterium]|nr:hypothetical protein [Planctomycetia bacterium]
MFCTQCGNEIQQEMKCCPSCGNLNVGAVPQATEISNKKPCCSEDNSGLSKENVCRCAAKIGENQNQLTLESTIDQLLKQRSGGKGFGITGLVCGIVAFCIALGLLIFQIYADFSKTFSFFPYQCIFNLLCILSILGNIFSAGGLATVSGRGKGIAGFILSTLAMAIALTLISLSS